MKDEEITLYDLYKEVFNLLKKTNDFKNLRRYQTEFYKDDEMISFVYEDGFTTPWINTRDDDNFESLYRIVKGLHDAKNRKDS